VKRLLFAVIGLLALFTIIRAYTEEGGSRYIVQPGLLEFENAEGGLRVAFGFLERGRGEGGARAWNLFPVRISLRAGKQQFVIALNGLSLFGPGGVVVGKAVKITGIKRGDVVSVGGPVTVQGTVEGDVWTLGADVKLLAGASVTGDVVALGGTVQADRRASIGGNKQSLPSVKIPFIGLLSSEHSAATFRFIVEVLGVLLFLLVLFLLVHFSGRNLLGLSRVLASRWKGVLLYLVLAILVLPVAVALLVASILGMVLVPALAVVVVVAAYAGFTGVTVRLGLWMRGRRGEVSPGEAYASGLLGLLVLKGPVLLGILFTLLTAELFQGIGRFLSGLGTAAVYVAALYGFGGVLQYLRQAREPAGGGS
jgi:hypothetical protein